MSSNEQNKLKPNIALLSPKRHVERSILILDKDDESLFEKSWNEFQSGIGLFSGLGVKWREEVISNVESLFIENKAIAEIYYQGLRDEFVYIHNRINYFKVQYNYSSAIMIEYVNPGIENSFVEISEEHMNKIIALAEAISARAQDYLDSN